MKQFLLLLSALIISQLVFSQRQFPVEKPTPKPPVDRVNYDSPKKNHKQNNKKQSADKAERFYEQEQKEKKYHKNDWKECYYFCKKCGKVVYDSLNSFRPSVYGCNKGGNHKWQKGCY